MSNNNHNASTSASGIRSDVLPLNKNMVATGNIGAMPKSYSQTTKSGPKYLSNINESFPKKDQAVVLPSHPEITTEEYIKAISQLISPKNIIYAQKINNNRMCLFLKSKAIVESLIETTNSINIKEYSLPIRKLINPATRIIITGGSPIIPHIIIEKALIEHKIKLATGVTFMRTSIKTPEFTHIQSFNRQFFANIPEGDIIPETLTVTFEEETYRLFLNVSGTCYKCKQIGHVVKECPLNIRNEAQVPAQLVEETTEDNIIIPDTQESEEMIVENTGINITIPETQPDIETVPVNRVVEKLVTKRIVTTSSSSQSEAETSKKQNKKQKTSIPIEEMLSPLKPSIENNPNDFVLTYENLKKYITESKGCRNIRELTQKYTNDVNLMIDMLRKLYPELKQSSIKSRFTKITNILETENQNIDLKITNTDSDGE